MSKPEWLVPGYPDLGGNVGMAAVEGQIVNYPMVVRTQVDDPIPNQTMANVSFMLFKEPRKMRNGKMVYGFFKARGNWSTAEQAKHQGSKIVKTLDSKNKVYIAPVGHWLPIAEEDALAKEIVDVQSDDDKRNVNFLRNNAAKEKRDKEKQMMLEIREREKELTEGGDIYDDKEALTYYSMRRVTEMTLVEGRENQMKKLESTKKILHKVRKELKRIEQDHPEYKDQWIDRYNEERAKGGVPDYIPAEDQFDEYENTHFDTLEDSVEE